MLGMRGGGPGYQRHRRRDRVELVDGQVQATRPVYAGKLLAEVSGERKPLLISLRPRAFPQPEPDAGRTGDVRTGGAGDGGRRD